MYYCDFNTYVQPNFDFVLHDIRQPLYVEVDEIYNLACPAAPIHYQVVDGWSIENRHTLLRLLSVVF